MLPISFTTRILKDGHIPPPSDAGLASGDLVQVTVTRIALEAEDASPQMRWVLDNLIGIGDSGFTDTALRHDDILAEEFERKG